MKPGLSVVPVCISLLKLSRLCLCVIKQGFNYTLFTWTSSLSHTAAEEPASLAERLDASVENHLTTQMRSPILTTVSLNYVLGKAKVG